MTDSIPNDLEEKINYYKKQNEFLKNKLRKLTEKYRIIKGDHNV